MEGGDSRFKGRPRKPVSAYIKGKEINGLFLYIVVGRTDFKLATVE